MAHIRILVPSGKIDFSLIEGARQRLELWGHRVTLSRHALEPEGRFGGSVEHRLEDLREAFSDPSIDYVLCARGGYGIVQLLPSVNSQLSTVNYQLSTINYQLSPTLIGFSDITALHCCMALQDRPSLHAVMCKHLSEYDTHREACDALRRVLDGEPVRYELPAHPLNIQGEAEGIARGGNLSVFYGLQGTPYAIRQDEPFLLFIEDVGERPYAIDRMMNNLRLSGMLDRASGFIIGQFSDYEEDPLMGQTVLEGIHRMLLPYGKPAVFDFPAGHVTRNLPLWLNRHTTLRVSAEGTVLAN